MYAILTRPTDSFELRFASLFDDGRGFSFPCDAAGHVDLDAMTPRARDNYSFARATVGRNYACPSVQPHRVH